MNKWITTIFSWLALAGVGVMVWGNVARDASLSTTGAWTLGVALPLAGFGFLWRSVRLGRLAVSENESDTFHPRIIQRKSDPRTFWFMIILCGAICTVILVGSIFGLIRQLQA